MAGNVKIVRVIARMNVGGPARQIMELAKGLAPRGFDTIVATGDPAGWEGDLREAARNNNIEIVNIPGLGARVAPFADARALSAIIPLLRKVRPDIVHTHTAKAGVLGRLAARFVKNARRVHTFHGTVFEHYFSRGVSSWIARAERMLARSTDRIVAVSHSVADEIENIGVDPSKIRVIEPVIDLAPYFEQKRGGAFRAELNIPDGAPLIGWVGRLVDIKDPATFVQAASIVSVDRPDARFVMIGAGPRLDDMRALAQQLGLGERIAFPGLRGDMANIYRDMEIVVNTSRKEGMPVSLLEAMAAGVPAIATAVGGTPELIAEERSGMLVPPGDARALARAIGRYFELPAEDRATMRGVSRVRAREKFGLARGLSRHEMLYRELLC